MEPMQPDADRAALLALAVGCERYSPCVGLEEAEHPECLLLDITGVSPLFGGEPSLAERIDREFSKQGYEARLAIADSVGAAWAAARFLAQPHQPAVLPPGRSDLLGPLPLEGLRLSEVDLSRLHRLGLKTIQQVAQLDRHALPPRFSPELNLRLAQFWGERHELITPCRPAPKFEVAHFLEEPTTHPQAIEQLARILLQRLLAPLEARQAGLRQLCCEFVLESKPSRNLSLRLCEPAADPVHLAELLQLKFAELQLDGPLLGMRMTACEISPLFWPQQELFADRPRHDARCLSTLLNRLSSRLGRDAVVRPRLRADPVPEQAVEFVPATEAESDPFAHFAKVFLPVDRPTCLWPRPQPVEVHADPLRGHPCDLWWNGSQFPIARSWGPERIESGWWRGPEVRRDYYHVEATDGRRFWLFRRLTDHRWFLHGALS
jgi:protein ImuB